MNLRFIDDVETWRSKVLEFGAPAYYLKEWGSFLSDIEGISLSHAIISHGARDVALVCISSNSCFDIFGSNYPVEITVGVPRAFRPGVWWAIDVSCDVRDMALEILAEYASAKGAVLSLSNSELPVRAAFELKDTARKCVPVAAFYTGWSERISSKRRRDVLREQRRFTKDGFSIQRREIGDDINLIASLCSSVERRFDPRFDEEKQVFEIERIGRRMGATAELKVAVDAGGVVRACVIALRCGRVIDVRHYGEEEELSRLSCVYQNLAYYSYLEELDNDFVDEVFVGPGAIEFKKSRGALAWDVCNYSIGA